MRTLKFRAYSKKLGMSEPTDFKTLVSTATDFNEFDVYMQFTGLVDRHGVEIYEGDIVRWTLNPMGGEPETKHMPVERLDNGLYVPHINNTSEVIGNIYENPELLKKEANQ